MRHTEIKIEQITERKYEAHFELINDVGVKALISISGETKEEVQLKAEKFLSGTYE